MVLWLYKEEEEGCVEGGINGRSKKTNKKRTEVEEIKSVAQPPEHILMTY